jgi:hypothetical protein
MSDAEYLEMARLAEAICRRFEAPLFLATTVELFVETGHLPIASAPTSSCSRRSNRQRATRICRDSVGTVSAK